MLLINCTSLGKERFHVMLSTQTCSYPSLVSSNEAGLFRVESWKEMVKGSKGGWRVGRIPRAYVGVAGIVPVNTNRSSTSN